MKNKQKPDDWWSARKRMVEEQIRSRGITDQGVLESLLAIPREQFIPPDIQKHAYDDRALATIHHQTISQPYIVAYMTQWLAIQPDSNILEIGTGTGYQTAILARLGQHVFTIERWPNLQQQAKTILKELGILNITYHIADGSLGWVDHAPFDRIIVTAGTPRIPPSLVDQLVDGGICVLPVGPKNGQTLVRVIRQQDRFIQKSSIACRFVKLIGQEGWNENESSLSS